MPHVFVIYSAFLFCLNAALSSLIYVALVAAPPSPGGAEGIFVIMLLAALIVSLVAVVFTYLKVRTIGGCLVVLLWLGGALLSIAFQVGAMFLM